MAIHDNSTTLGYVRIVGAIVTYNDMLYTLSEFITNKKYIYWDLSNPYLLKDSNELLSTSQTVRLVVINNFGMHTVVPSTTDNFLITFDGDQKKNIDRQILGLHVTDEEHVQRFMAVERDVTGIHQTIGNREEHGGTIWENVSRIDEEADRIDFEVVKNRTELDDTKLRDEVNGFVMTLNADLGLFHTKTTEYFRDDKVSSIEKTEINAHYDVITKDKKNLYDKLEEILDMCDYKKLTKEKQSINSAKDSLNTAHANLKSILDSVISDAVITPSDRVLISNVFAQYNLKINELQNTVNEVITLGMGGTISREVAKIHMQSNEITLSVQDSEKRTNAKLQIHSDKIGLLVGETGGSNSEFYVKPDGIKIGFNGISDSVIIDKYGLTVNQGSIACDAITTPSGHDPIIRFFDTCSIDATYNNETGGKGDAIRLKWDRRNYVSVSDSEICLYQGGTAPITSFNKRQSTINTDLNINGETWVNASVWTGTLRPHVKGEYDCGNSQEYWKIVVSKTIWAIDHYKGLPSLSCSNVSMLETKSLEEQCLELIKKSKFIKPEPKMKTFNNTTKDDEMPDFKLDIGSVLGNPVGKYIYTDVSKEAGQDGTYSYNYRSHISVLQLALQQVTNNFEEYKEQIENRLIALENK